MKVKGFVKSVIVSIFTSIVLVFTLGLGVGFFVDNKEPSFQAQKQFNDLTINQSFSDNQYLIINGKAYAYTNEQQDNTQVNPAATMTNLYTLTFDKNNTLELIFLKDEYTSLNSTNSTVFTIDNSDIASKFQAVKNEDGTISIQIIDTSDVVEITTSTDADYTLYGLAFSTQATLNYANGEFSIGEKRGPVSLVDTITKNKVQILNMANGSFTFSGDKTYSPKENTPGRAFYQTGGTLTLDGITLDGFWIPLVEGDLFSMIANPTEEMLGGTIYSSAGTLNLNCNVVNSISTLGSVTVGGTTNVTGGEYYNNFAMAGACIGTLYGTLNVENAAFYNNFAAAGTALTNLGGTLNITNCTVANNFTEMYGAITTMFGETTINSGSYFGNFGGAGSVCMLADNSTLIINDGEFYNNYTDWIGGVVNVCPLEDGAPATFTVNGGYYHDNYQEEAVTYTLPEKAALMLGVPEEDRSMVINPTNDVMGYVFFMHNSSGMNSYVGTASSTLNLNGGTFSNNVPEDAVYPAEICLLDAQYITLGAELTQDISVIKPQAKAMALGDSPYAYIAHSTDSTILQSAVEHLQVQGIPLFPENLSTDAVENYLVITSVTDYGLYNIETMEHVYSWQQLLDNGYINVSDTTVTGFDNSWDVYGLLIIPEHITAIADMAFAETEFVGGVYLPENLTSLGLGSFALSVGMSAFAVHKDNTAFVSMYGILLNYEQDRIVSVPPQMAQGTMEVPSMFTGAEAAACAGCIYLTDVILPSTFTQIEMGTFLFCTELKTIVIPDSVEYIGQAAFTYCQSAELFDFRTATNIPVLETDKSMLGLGVFDYVPSDAKIYVPTELYYDWIEAEGWSDYAYLIYADGVGLVGGPGIYNYDTSELLMSWADLIANNVLTVSGGTLGIGSNAETMIGSLQGLRIKLVISSDVKTIPDQLFGEQQWLASVTIPNTVTSIGQQAFYGCGLEEIIIKDAPCSIGMIAFGMNQNVKVIDIGDNIRTFGALCFAMCLGYEEGSNGEKRVVDAGTIKISASATVQEAAFIGCGVSAFEVDSGHSSLCSVNGILYSKDRKTLITCPAAKSGPVDTSNLTGMGPGAFMYCANITGEILLPSTMNKITAPLELLGGEMMLFMACGMSKLTINASVTDIPRNSFSDCPNLTEVVGADGVVTIGVQAFMDCAKFERISLPVIQTIASNAFEGCTSLQSVYLGTQLTTLGSSAFKYCRSLSGTITIPSTCSMIEPYVFQECESLEGVIFDDCSTSIGNMAFWNCLSLRTLDLGSNITSIGQSAFRSTGIQGSVVIPDTCGTIDSYAFHSCTGITRLTIGTNVSTIGTAAFYGCSNIEYINMKSTQLTTVGTEAFISLSKMAGTIAFPSTCSSIGISAFQGCAKLTGVSFAGPTAINNLAFYNCSSLKTLSLGTKVTSIGQSAFRNTALAGAIAIPDTCTTIGDYAFQDLKGITSLSIGNGVTSVGQLAFYNCTGITSLTLGDSIQTIGASAFRNISKATGAINLPNIISIGNYAFHTCSGLTSVTMGGTISQVGDGVFANCTNILTHWYIASTSIPTLTNANGFNGINANCKIWVPGNLYDAWVTATNWSNWRPYIYAFNDNSGLFDANGNKIYTWSQLIDNGLITVSSDGTRITGCDKSIAGKLVISNEITTIGTSAFEECTGLTGIVLSDSVTTVKNKAFYKCTGITSVELGQGLKVIEETAFGGLSGLGDGYTFVLPSSLENVGLGAFAVFNRGWSYVFDCMQAPIEFSHPYGDSWAYGDCTFILPYEKAYDVVTSRWIQSHENIVWKDESGNTYSFEDAAGLYDDVTNERIYTWSELINNGYITVDGETISASTSAINGKLVFHPEITTIGTFAFSGRTGLTSVVLVKETRFIKQNAFYNCTGLKTFVTYNNWATEHFESNAFYGCTSLQAVVSMNDTDLANITFDNAYSNPLYYAKRLYYLNGTTEITTCGWGTNPVAGYPNSLVGNYAFYNCLSFTSVAIEGNFDIGSYSFAYCSNVLTYDFSGYDDSKTYLPACGVGAFDGINANAQIIVPAAKYYDWIVAPNWSTYKDYIVPDGELPDVNGGLYDTSGNKVYTWDELVANNYITVSGTTITSANYSNISGKLVIPSTITEIGESAFSMCTNLTSVEFRQGLTTIGKQAFYWTGLSGVITLPHSLTTIGDKAFGFAPEITGISIGPNVSSIGTAIFDPNIYGENSKITSIYVNPNNPNFSSGGVGYSTTGPALFNKNKTTLLYFAPGWSGNFTVPSTVTTIATRAFVNHRKLTGITMTSVKTIETEAFLTCTALQYVEFGSAISTLAQNSFYWDVGSNPDANDYANYGSNVQYYNFNSATKVPTCSGSFINMIGASSYIYVPSSLLSSWKAASYWSTWADYITTGTPTLTTKLNTGEKGIASLMISTDNIEANSTNKTQVVLMDKLGLKDDDVEDVDNNSTSGNSGDGDGNNDGTNVSANVPTKTTTT